MTLDKSQRAPCLSFPICTRGDSDLLVKSFKIYSILAQSPIVLGVAQARSRRQPCPHRAYSLDRPRVGKEAQRGNDLPELSGRTRNRTWVFWLPPLWAIGRTASNTSWSLGWTRVGPMPTYKERGETEPLSLTFTNLHTHIIDRGTYVTKRQTTPGQSHGMGEAPVCSELRMCEAVAMCVSDHMTFLCGVTLLGDRAFPAPLHHAKASCLCHAATGNVCGLPIPCPSPVFS